MFSFNLLLNGLILSVSFCIVGLTNWTTHTQIAIELVLTPRSVPPLFLLRLRISPDPSGYTIKRFRGHINSISKGFIIPCLFPFFKYRASVLIVCHLLVGRTAGTCRFSTKASSSQVPGLHTYALSFDVPGPTVRVYSATARSV